MLAGFLYLPPLADLLDQAPPTWVGFVIAAFAIDGAFVARTTRGTFDPGQPKLLVGS